MGPDRGSRPRCRSGMTRRWVAAIFILAAVWQLFFGAFSSLQLGAPGVGDRASWVPNVLVLETVTLLPVGFPPVPVGVSGRPSARGDLRANQPGDRAHRRGDAEQPRFVVHPRRAVPRPSGTRAADVRPADAGVQGRPGQQLMSAPRNESAGVTASVRRFSLRAHLARSSCREAFQSPRRSGSQAR